MAEPKCPECQVSGVDYIVAKTSRQRSKTKQPWFLIVHCDNCGYVYDILAKHVFQIPVTPKFILEQ